MRMQNYDNKRYVRANVSPSMKKTPYRVVIEFSPTCDVLRAACTCPVGLGLQGKGKCNHVGGVLPSKTFPGEVYSKTQNL